MAKTSPDQQLKTLRDELLELSKKFKAVQNVPTLGMIAKEAHMALYDQVLEIDGWMGWDE